MTTNTLQDALKALGPENSEGHQISIGGTEITVFTSGWNYQDEAAAIAGTDVEAIYGTADTIQSLFAVADLGHGLSIGGFVAIAADLIGPGDWQPPAFIDAVPDLRMTSFGAVIDKTGTTQMLRVAFSYGNGHTYQIIPDFLAIGDLRAELTATHPFDATQRHLKLGASGVLTIGTVSIAVTLEAEHGPDPQHLEDIGEGNVNDLATVMAETLSDATASSDQPAADGELLDIDGLKAAFSQADEEASHAPPPFAHVKVSGHLEQGPEDEISLADMLDHFGLGHAGLGETAKIAQAGFFYDSDGDLYQVHVAVAGPRLDTEADPLDAPWEVARDPILSLADGGLALERVLISLSGSVSDGSFTGTIAADLEVAGAFVNLTATCSTATEGLFLSGSWRADDAPLALRFADVAPVPDQVEAPQKDLDHTGLNKFFQRQFNWKLPETLSSLTVTRMDVTVQTAQPAFKFQLDGKMDLDVGRGNPVPVDVLISVDFHKTDQSKFEGHIGGVIVVHPDGADGPAFELDLDLLLEGDATSFLAGFRDTTLDEEDDLADKSDAPKEGAYAEDTSALGALVERLGFDDLAAHLGGDAALSVTIRELFFAMRHETGPDQRLTLLGVDLGAGLDFSKITLPDLPVIGVPDTSGLPKLRLNLKLAMMHGAGDRSALASYVEAQNFTLPDGDTDLRVDAVLRVGQSKLTVPDGPTPDSLDTITPQPENTDIAPVAAPLSLGQQATWLPIHRSFGPVAVKRMGVTFNADGPQGFEISALLDASLEAAGLTISLDGLAVTSPVCALNPRFSLDGLGIDYRDPVVKIGGALHSHNGAFSGSVIAGTDTLTLAGFGAFETITDPITGEAHASFMADVFVDYPIGGPAFFFVTGLCGAIGYNRAINLPDVSGIADFPLIKQALDGPGSSDPSADLSMIPPAIGQNFLSVGVVFTSFKLVDSVALLTFQLGDTLEIDLIGVSTFENPPKISGADPLVHLRILWAATFKPDEGTLNVRAEIEPGAFILDKSCKISGGMAMSCWFTDQSPKVRAGDFVLTIGGYHPHFQRPSHYPIVQPLKLDWVVNSHLTIKGTAYFALTSGAIMAGGHLHATWTSTGVRATFSIKADFLMMWQPHHYEASFEVSIHAVATYEGWVTFHATFDATAKFNVWGPDFSGDATVHVDVLGYDMSFGISFGDSPRLAKALSWEDAKKELLPEKCINLTPVDGLLAAATKAQAEAQTPTFDPHRFAVTVNSAIPCQKISMHKTVLKPARETDFGMVPIGLTNLEHAVDIQVVNSTNRDDVSDKFRATPITQSVPAALWGVPEIDTKRAKYGIYLKPPRVNPNQSVPDALVGITLRAMLPKAEPLKDAPLMPPPKEVDTPDIERHDLVRYNPGTDPDAPAPGTVAQEEQRAMMQALGFGNSPTPAPRGTVI